MHNLGVDVILLKIELCCDIGPGHKSSIVVYLLLDGSTVKSPLFLHAQEIAGYSGKIH
jgi:hypothetical protein